MEGHFIYTDGSHGTDLVKTEELFLLSSLVSDLGNKIATDFKDDGIEIVVEIDQYGALLAHSTACHLGEFTGREVLSVPVTVTTNNAYGLRSGHCQYVHKKKVLVVVDIVHSGNTVRKVVHMLRRFGAEVVGIGAICNRGDVKLSDIGDVPKFFALAELRLKTWPAEVCRTRGPCARGQPKNDALSHRKPVFPTGK